MDRYGYHRNGCRFPFLFTAIYAAQLAVESRKAELKETAGSQLLAQVQTRQGMAQRCETGIGSSHDVHCLFYETARPDQSQAIR